jgi:hypothetical protein
MESLDGKPFDVQRDNLFFQAFEAWWHDPYNNVMTKVVHECRVCDEYKEMLVPRVLRFHDPYCSFASQVIWPVDQAFFLLRTIDMPFSPLVHFLPSRNDRNQETLQFLRFFNFIHEHPYPFWHQRYDHGTYKSESPFPYPKTIISLNKLVSVYIILKKFPMQALCRWAGLSEANEGTDLHSPELDFMRSYDAGQWYVFYESTCDHNEGRVRRTLVLHITLTNNLRRVSGATMPMGTCPFCPLPIPDTATVLPSQY